MTYLLFISFFAVSVCGSYLYGFSSGYRKAKSDIPIRLEGWYRGPRNWSFDRNDIQVGES